MVNSQCWNKHYLGNWEVGVKSAEEELLSDRQNRGITLCRIQ
jgi:hypothetical protein